MVGARLLMFQLLLQVQQQQPVFDQFLTSYWPVLGKLLSVFGQFLDKFWPVFGQFLAKFLSVFGQFHKYTWVCSKIVGLLWGVEGCG